MNFHVQNKLDAQPLIAFRELITEESEKTELKTRQKALPAVRYCITLYRPRRNPINAKIAIIAIILSKELFSGFLGLSCTSPPKGGAGVPKKGRGGQIQNSIKTEKSVIITKLVTHTNTCHRPRDSRYIGEAEGLRRRPRLWLGRRWRVVLPVDPSRNAGRPRRSNPGS